MASIDILDGLRQFVIMNQPVPISDRQDAILDAAFQTFATYGFRRTVMDDIAKRAGMSRSALYLHYRNKEDIFRSLTERFFVSAVDAVADALKDPTHPAEQSLAAAFLAKDGTFMDVVLATAHGSDLLDAGFSISADIVQAGEDRITAILADWLDRRRLPDGMGTAREIAGTIMIALKGVKTSVRTIDDYRAGQARLARLFGRALTP